MNSILYAESAKDKGKCVIMCISSAVRILNINNNRQILFVFELHGYNI